jgi:hypothetical protein
LRPDRDHPDKQHDRRQCRRLFHEYPQHIRLPLLEHKKNIVPFLFQESSRSYQVSSTGALEKYGLVNPGNPTERTGIAPDSKSGPGITLSVPCSGRQQTGWHPEGAGASSVTGRTFPLPSKDPKSRTPSVGRPACWRVGIRARATPRATPTGWRRPEGSRLAGLQVCFAFRSYAPKTGRFLGSRAAINQIGSSARRPVCIRFI